MTIPMRRNRTIAERDAERAAVAIEIAAQQALKDAACEDAYTAKVAVDTAVTAVATAITDEVTNQGDLDVLDATVASTLSDMDAAQDAYDALGVDADRSAELTALNDAIVAYKAAVVAQDAGKVLMPTGAKIALVLAKKAYNEAQAAAEALLAK